jgi:hypothetical protein
MGISNLQFQQMRQRVGTANEEPHEKESELRALVLGYCKANMWIALSSVTHKRTNRVCGEPDVIAILPGGSVIFAELKAAKKKLSQEQLALKAWMNKLGHTCHLIYTLAEFVAVCDAALAGNKRGESFEL